MEGFEIENIIPRACQDEILGENVTPRASRDVCSEFSAHKKRQCESEPASVEEELACIYPLFNTAEGVPIVKWKVATKKNKIISASKINKTF